MSLITDINDIVTALSPEATFTFSSYFKASRESHQTDPESFPFVVMDNELVKNSEIMKNNMVNAETRIKIYFLNHDRPDNTDLERETIRQGMEDLANRVMVQIYQLSYIKIKGTDNQKYKITPVFNAFMTQKSGVVAEMLGIEQLIVNFCLNG